MKLRIISGAFKGRRILVPKSELVRPTTDRVRETLFNILNNRINFENIKVLDLYAGSGSLGLECLSRGAGTIHFVEQDSFISKQLEENIYSLLQDEKKCIVYKMSALQFVTANHNSEYDLILADPPFFKKDIYQVVEKVLSNKILSDESFMIIERSIQTKAKDIENFKTEPFKIIGDNCLYEISN
jgi:16S rRNA (guanine966-N2)-methyltransferase